MEYFGFCKEINEMSLSDIYEEEIYSGHFAKFYDTNVNDIFDVPLYEKLAREYGNHIMEFACGSGRILVELLKRGYDAAGLDISQDMLEILEEKCSKLDVKPTLVCDDMLRHVSSSKYDIIILARITICLLEDDETRIKLFNNVYNNLRDGGVFVFNYLDCPKEIELGEKRPTFLFDKDKKGYAIISEKILEDRSIVNIYSETNIDDKTKRYITSTSKYLLNNEMISNIIDQTAFKHEKTYTLNAVNYETGKMKFVVLKK
ncbi:class I SAM-dependent DNA methyltransferase [Vallitalea guaymasensis]|uniref:Class I SAM-dependent methyltransferase n=1 Tax=Vallitalea guaymasensis TaxID=1185412 RepID=A0A8J8SDU0_9FIRM|nr:class I SAM-dependent methyltransferase [Vallitalea guaymasensis]QUH30865.1 class I SAM-dependent methyltransferase [Vallitalea guaymasensis]